MINFLESVEKRKLFLKERREKKKAVLKRA